MLSSFGRNQKENQKKLIVFIRRSGNTSCAFCLREMGYLDSHETTSAYTVVRCVPEKDF